MKLQEKARWSVGAALAKLMNVRPEKRSELIEAANLLQGPAPFPTPAPIPVHPAPPTTNAICGMAPSPPDGNMEFDFRPYLDNQNFEPASYDDLEGAESSAESILPPHDFEKLFSSLVTPSMCPSVLMNARDMVDDYPLELLEMPKEIFEGSPRGIV